MSASAVDNPVGVERQQMSVDIAGVGFGPAMGGFLTTLSRNLLNEDGTPRLESTVVPGMPLQVICYERADGLGFGVSGAVTRARGIRASFPDADLTQVPMAAAVKKEKLVYLLDPIGASRRSLVLRACDRVIRLFGLGACDSAVELPFIPKFMHKGDGLIFSLGQFNQWVSDRITSSGLVQIWPGMPVSEALIDGESVSGIRLADQGVSVEGRRETGFMPGMDIRAALTVVADGPVGAVGRQIDECLGLPQKRKGLQNKKHPPQRHRDTEKTRERDEWALGMKMVVELREDSELKAGTVLHTIGFPEPEIFGFLYVHPGRLASVGIFVPSWMQSPVRTAYRYLQHFMLHPYLWRHLQGGRLKSWGAKSLQESGRRGEPFLAGNGYARIGEGSGSTNVLAGSGVDEAWTTGTQLAKAVIELLQQKKSFTRENLEEAYVRHRRASWVDKECRIAANARNGFQYGVVTGLVGMALAGFTKGRVFVPARRRTTGARAPAFTPEQFYGSQLPANELRHLQEECAARGTSLHDSIMDNCGWPAIPLDGHLLISHQDALLMGGSVQALPGYANHVVFVRPELCQTCEPKLCVEMCSGQAITRGEGGVPAFDREKCVFCGACLWNCTATVDGHRGNIDFRAGAGGLHSAMN
jgi:electron-transferring-flavoprotein dehydrogenase